MHGPTRVVWTDLTPFPPQSSRLLNHFGFQPAHRDNHRIRFEEVSCSGRGRWRHPDAAHYTPFAILHRK
jgi:hypothetical protein